jgi:hypothetical protein
MADDLDDLLARDTIKAPASVELPVHPVIPDPSPQPEDRPSA